MWFVEKSRIVGEHNSPPTPPTIRDHQTERNQTGETAKGKCVQVRTRLLRFYKERVTTLLRSFFV